MGINLKTKTKRESQRLDMREFIQMNLDLWGLGKLVAVVGPTRGGRDNDQSWWELVIKYRPEEGGHHFDDKRIEVYLGYRSYGGYWNRRNIRLAIEGVGKEKQRQEKTREVWSSAQKELTAGPIAL